PPLHVGNTAVRKKHEQIRARATAKGLDRGPASIPGSRDHDGRTLSARRERLIHESAKELHRQILERERGPMKQFEYEIAHAKLHQWSDRRMAEPAIGLARHAGEVAIRDGVADEGTDDLHRHFRIRASGKDGDRVRIEPRPRRGQVEAAVAVKSCQRRLDKTERRGLAPGGNVAHEPGAPFEAKSPSRWALFAQRTHHVTF